MKDTKFDPISFLNIKLLSPLESSSIRGGLAYDKDKKKQKQKQKIIIR
jgi:hypothetical protein